MHHFDKSFFHKVAPVCIDCSLERKKVFFPEFRGGLDGVDICFQGLAGLSPVSFSLLGSEDKELLTSFCSEINDIIRDDFIMSHRDNDYPMERTVNGFVELYGYLVGVAVRLCREFDLDYKGARFSVTHADSSICAKIPLGDGNWCSVYFSNSDNFCDDATKKSNEVSADVIFDMISQSPLGEVRCKDLSLCFDSCDSVPDRILSSRIIDSVYRYIASVAAA